jgi:tight adherence protein C
MQFWTQVMADPAMLSPIVIFVTVFGLVVALSGRQSPAALRLARHRIGGMGVAAVPSAGRSVPLSWRSRFSRPDASRRLTTLVNTEKRAAETRTLLNRAGSPMSPAAYARLRYLFTFALTPLVAILAVVVLGPSTQGLAAAAVALVATPRLPAIHLKRLAKQRAREMDVVLSDVLDLLVVCVEGGQSLSAALMQVAQRMDNVAAEEFGRLLADVNSGMSRRDAFGALADRCQSEALSIACTTIIHADKVGMSLAGTLRTLSDMMRTRRRQAAETRARQAPIKMMPVLVGFMLPTLLALLLGPVALEVLATFR